ncbi:MAG: DUF2304 domain-containing protein [Gammaproteobacteria bacterium]|nr:MAG: DUF2304 domain-containing protein [Gammaproteobacteria bacterium]
MTYWISAVGGLLTAVLIIYLIRRDHLHTRYALWWIPVALIIAILGLFPQITDWIAPSIGVHYGPVIPLLTGLIALTLKILIMDIERSRNETKLNRIVQKLAILEQALQQLTENSAHKPK